MIKADVTFDKGEHGGERGGAGDRIGPPRVPWRLYEHGAVHRQPVAVALSELPHDSPAAV